MTTIETLRLPSVAQGDDPGRIVGDEISGTAQETATTAGILSAPLG